MSDPENPPEPGSRPTETPADPSAEQKRTLRERREELRARTEAAKRTLETRAEDLRARHETVRVAYAAYERDRRQAGGLLAGGMAFRLFLWLLPAALTVVSLVQLIGDVSSRTPEEMARSAGLSASLTAAVAQAAAASGNGAVWLLILGTVLMLWAAIGMVKALRLLSAVAWQVRLGPLRRAIRAAAVASGVGIGVAAEPILLGPLYRGGVVSDVFVSLITVGLLTAIVTWIMTTLPRPEGTTWIGLLPGALVIAVGAEIVRLIGSVYLAPRLGRTSDLYGALGLAAVFLAWLYLLGRLLVAGLTLNAELWRRRRAAAVGDANSVTPRDAAATREEEGHG